MSRYTADDLRLMRRGAYIVVAIALAVVTGLQAHNGDWIAATIAGLGTAAQLLAMANTKPLAPAIGGK